MEISSYKGHCAFAPQLISAVIHVLIYSPVPSATAAQPLAPENRSHKLIGFDYHKFDATPETFEQPSAILPTLADIAKPLQVYQ